MVADDVLVAFRSATRPQEHVECPAGGRSFLAIDPAHVRAEQRTQRTLPAPGGERDAGLPTQLMDEAVTGPETGLHSLMVCRFPGAIREMDACHVHEPLLQERERLHAGSQERHDPHAVPRGEILNQETGQWVAAGQHERPVGTRLGRDHIDAIRLSDAVVRDRPGRSHLDRVRQQPAIDGCPPHATVGGILWQPGPRDRRR